jgi:hypothetical protein
MPNNDPWYETPDAIVREQQTEADATFTAPVTLTNQTTTTTAPSAGAAGALPATPAGYLTVTINGTARKIAYY